MSEMVERVRAAILHAERFGKDRARAAIAAMREPTEAMADAGLATGEFENCEFIVTTDAPKGVWSAMIDEAPK